MISIYGIESAVVLLGGDKRAAAVEAHLDGHGRIGFQHLGDRVVVEGINLDADPVEVAQLVRAADFRRMTVQQILGSLIISAFRIWDVVRIHVAVEFSLRGRKCEIRDFNELSVNQFCFRLTALRNDEGEGGQQHFGTARFQHGIGFRHVQFLHFFPVNGHCFSVVGAEIDTHHRFVLVGTEQGVVDVLRLDE